MSCQRGRHRPTETMYIYIYLDGGIDGIYEDDDDDMYIYYDAVFVCLSRKMSTFPS